MRFTWLIPREKKFFDMLEMETEAVHKGAQYLNDLMANYENVEDAFNKIKEIEHKTDNIVHTIFEALNTTFITPIDSEDISRLASALDDILDHIYAAVRRIHIYKIKKPTQSMIDFATVLLNACQALDCSVKGMKKLEKPENIEERCVEINRLENVADEINNRASVELFKLDDVKEIIKIKQIYDFFESATDRCEDAANVISDIVIKSR